MGVLSKKSWKRLQHSAQVLWKESSGPKTWSNIFVLVVGWIWIWLGVDYVEVLSKKSSTIRVCRTGQHSTDFLVGKFISFRIGKFIFSGQFLGIRQSSCCLIIPCEKVWMSFGWKGSYIPTDKCGRSLHFYW